MRMARELRRSYTELLNVNNVCRYDGPIEFKIAYTSIIILCKR